ncbi:TetR/AcrR family transcriptional regulator [Microbacterium sp. H1-D42]|uniref:TetR/AcrR family transcriptional regulator n=1 Tax=Microbacterium sp. H1-D42 TaxID=2925844 RepID=UPI001F53C06D|nr:TetR/AcrR family transcriptional regulator [Microbacterium sp. H1-D42]UNK71865.1 TetR/AcrR family transcriptional regulator [Microbacterium sp. H1-D42]
MTLRATTEPAKAESLAIAAFELFSTRGIDGVSMDDVAARAGVTKGSLYWHYSSKKEIILAACVQYYARWRVQMAEATEQTSAPWDRVVAAVEFSVHSCLLDEANRVFTTEIVALALYDTEVRASWSGFLDETERLFLGLTHRAVGAGQLKCDDVDRAVELLLAAMEGVKQLTLFRPRYAAGDSAERTTRSLLSLLGAPTA